MENLGAAFAAAGHQAHTPDLRHHHEGAFGARDLKALAVTSMRDFAQDITGLVDGTEEKPVLIGHSMGGLLAQMLAAQGQARAIILLAPSAPWGLLPSHWEHYASGLGLFLTSGHYWERSIVPTYEIVAEHALDRMSKEERAQLFSRFVPESGRAMFETLQWWLDMSRATDVPAREVTCPVLCLTGARDRINPPETVKRIAARYRDNATYKEYPEMSHWLIGEPGWEQVAEDSLRWLRSIDSL
jgi:pimeloyl-ACP methyl ester carboxylesterase